MHPLYEQANKLSKEVYEAALEVKAFVGAGVVLESIYQRCLMRELELRGHKVACEVAVPITYKGYTFDEKLRLDLLVDDCLVVECKAVDSEKADMDRYRAQTLTYLKLMNLPLGLVINFAGTRFGKAGISRVILKDANKSDAT